MASTKKTATKKNTAPQTLEPPPKKKIRKKSAKKQAAKAEESIFRKKSIAERTAARKNRNWVAVLGWIGIVLFSLAALFFQFCMIGYSFSALVCLSIVGIILVYKALRLLGSKYPQDARTLKRIFTILLSIGLLVVGITEAIIIKASFGDPRQHCDYMVVLGAGVRGDVPSLSLRNRIDAAYD